LYYRGIVKRCTNCFQQHQRKYCKNEKVPWSDYVARFAEQFPEIPHDMYGMWRTMIKDVGLLERQNKSETENTIKPKEADPKTVDVQSGSLQSNTLEAGENREVDDGEEDDEDETEEEELARVIKKMKINSEENRRRKQTRKN
jgi:hypothetical protein